jgi:lipopolysaccharide biosynthesis glycosyltransferase
MMDTRTSDKDELHVVDMLGSSLCHRGLDHQDALNAVLAGELKELDLSWNVQLGALEYFDRVGWPTEREALRVRKAELLSNPKIVHFIGPSKPWSDGFTIPYRKQYRKMIAESGWLPRGLVIPWKVGWLASTIRATVKRRWKR